MAKPIIMPKQGQSVESCIITEWFKKKGDPVSPGDPLFSYETDKASFQEDATDEGVLLEVLCQEGDEVPVLANVAIIGQAGEDISALLKASSVSVPGQEQSMGSAPAQEKLKEVAVESSKPDGLTGTRLGVSPRARNMAAREAVSLDLVKGTGPNNRIVARDVAAIIEQRLTLPDQGVRMVSANSSMPASSVGDTTSLPLSNDSATGSVFGPDFEIKPLTHMRKLIAKAMHASLQNSAQLTHHLGADARNILTLRKEAKRKQEQGLEVNITLNDMVCFAVIRSLKKFPRINAHLQDDVMKVFRKVHLGVAVDTERGLMVPVLKNADDLSLQGLSNQLREIAAQCRKGNVNPELLSSEAASFTVSNLGNYGVELFTPVINLPQVAILGVNTIVPRPKELEEGVYGFVPFMGLSLTYDHRALDGGEASRFLKQVAVEIETLKTE